MNEYLSITDIGRIYGVSSNVAGRWLKGLGRAGVAVRNLLTPMAKLLPGPRSLGWARFYATY